MHALILDDDHGSRETLRFLLTHWGWTVTPVEDIAEGIRSLPEIKPDLVTTDIGHPGPTFLEVIQAVRDYDDSVAVMVVSGTLTPQRERQARDAGAKWCFDKPIDVFEIREALSEITPDVGQT